MGRKLLDKLLSVFLYYSPELVVLVLLAALELFFSLLFLNNISSWKRLKHKICCIALNQSKGKSSRISLYYVFAVIFLDFCTFSEALVQNRMNVCCKCFWMWEIQKDPHPGVKYLERAWWQYFIGLRSEWVNINYTPTSKRISCETLFKIHWFGDAKVKYCQTNFLFHKFIYFNIIMPENVIIQILRL